MLVYATALRCVGKCSLIASVRFGSCACFTCVGGRGFNPYTFIHNSTITLFFFPFNHNIRTHVIRVIAIISIFASEYANRKKREENYIELNEACNCGEHCFGNFVLFSFFGLFNFVSLRCFRSQIIPTGKYAFTLPLGISCFKRVPGAT